MVGSPGCEDEDGDGLGDKAREGCQYPQEDCDHQAMMAPYHYEIMATKEGKQAGTIVWVTPESNQEVHVSQQEQTWAIGESAAAHSGGDV